MGPILDQDQDSLLVKRRNDNHSPGVSVSYLENVSYLRHSYLIQRNYLTNKHSHFKEMRS